MDISTEMKLNLVKLMNKDPRAMSEPEIRVAFSDLKEIVESYSHATAANKALLNTASKGKTNARGNFPVLAADADVDDVAIYFFHLFDWLSANGLGALNILRPQVTTLFPQYTHSFGGGVAGANFTPYSGGYPAEPDHKGGNGYTVRGGAASGMEKSLKTATASKPTTDPRAMPKDKIMSFDRHGRMVLN
jgi:hypothetical protein